MSFETHIPEDEEAENPDCEVEGELPEALGELGQFARVPQSPSPAEPARHATLLPVELLRQRLTHTNT